MASFGLGNTSAAAALAIQSVVDASTPWMAASEGNLPLLQSSLDTLGLPATAQDENGYALIHAAASYNQITILQWLLGQGAHVHAVDHEGDGVLHYSGNAMTAQFLVMEGKVSPALVNVEGKTALQAKVEELEEMMEDEDVEEDDEDLEALKDLVKFLKSL
jgi:Ankyrin repeats (many copies)